MLLGCVACCVGRPLYSLALLRTTDMVKTRLQSGAGYKGPIDAAQAILKNEGVAGFYRGAYKSGWRWLALALEGRWETEWS